MSEPPQRAASGPPGYFAGLWAPLAGFRLLQSAPRLWYYVWQPVLINVALTIGVAIGGFFLAREGFVAVRAALGEAWWEIVLVYAALIVIVAVTIAIVLAAYVLLQGLCCAVFFTVLAKQVELHLGTPGSELHEPPLRAQIIDGLRAAFKLLAANVLLLVLNVVPLAGAGAALIIGLYIDAYILGAEFLGYPLELRGVRWLQRQQFAKSHMSITLGLGTAVSALLLVPILGAVLQATAVVGAVLLYHRTAKS